MSETARAKMERVKMEDQRRYQSLGGFTVPPETIQPRPYAAYLLGKPRQSKCEEYYGTIEPKTSPRMKKLYRQRMNSLIFFGILAVAALAVCIFTFGKGVSQ